MAIWTLHLTQMIHGTWYWTPALFAAAETWRGAAAAPRKTIMQQEEKEEAEEEIEEAAVEI